MAVGAILRDIRRLRVQCVKREERPAEAGQMSNSVPASPTVEAAAENQQNNEDDQQCSGIHRTSYQKQVVSAP